MGTTNLTSEIFDRLIVNQEALIEFIGIIQDHRDDRGFLNTLRLGALEPDLEVLPKSFANVFRSLKSCPVIWQLFQLDSLMFSSLDMRYDEAAMPIGGISRLFYEIGLSKETRGQNGFSTTEMMVEFGGFLSRVPCLQELFGLDAIDGQISKSDAKSKGRKALENFSKLSQLGSPSYQMPFFFSMVAIFVYNKLVEQKFVCDRLRRTMTPSDYALLDRLDCVLKAIIDDRHANTMVADFCFGPEKITEREANAMPVFDIGIRYDKKYLDDLYKWIELFKSPVDDWMHFVTYRAKLSSPSKLIKSYLAIGPEKVPHYNPNGDVVRFVHIYVPPGANAIAKHISHGRVVTWEHGTYLIGGRRRYRPGEGHIPPEHKLLDAIEVIALPRGDGDSPISGITLTTNNTKTNIASRIVLLPTPVSHSDRVGGLGEVSAADLEKDLVDHFDGSKDLLNAFVESKDFDNQEKAKYFQGELDHFFNYDIARGRLRDANALANRILGLVNNNPASDEHWEVGTYPEFKNADGGILNDHVLMSKLTEALGTGRMAQFSTDSGVGFELWEHLKFSPIRIGG